MKCKLCEREFEKLAKSHILPIGFFNKLPTKGRVDSHSFDGSSKKRKLRKAIYDCTILCPSCEAKTSVLDDYAIKIFRDKVGSFEVFHPNQPDDKFVIFDDVDSKKLRAFLASLLWRVSHSVQREMEKLTIGKKFEARIANDLLNNGEFAYIDVSAYILTDFIHTAIFSPYRIKLDPVDKKRDHQTINGWAITLPNLLLRVSLDKRPHPERGYYDFAPELTNRPMKIKASSSLHADQDYKFSCFQTTTHEHMKKNIYSLVHQHMA